MAKLAEIGGVPGNVLGMLSDLTSKLQHGIIAPQELALFVKRQNPFGDTQEALIAEWERFYLKYFGREVALSSVRVPDDPGGFTRVLYIAAGITCNQVFDACKGKFLAWTLTDLAKYYTRNDRDTSMAYAIRVRDKQEADEQYAYHPGNEFRKADAPQGITLTERLVFELKYFDETRRHLDQQSRTLCIGSGSPDDGVPCVWSYKGSFNVGGVKSTDADASIRAREVVTV